MRHTRLLLTATASLLLFTACSSDDSGSADTSAAAAETAATAAETDAPDDGAATSGAATVTIQSSRFGPTELSIAAGASVAFTNDDPFDHTITSKDDSPSAYDSGNLGQGETFEQTYDEAGTYNFFCQIHPTMRGTITVT